MLNVAVLEKRNLMIWKYSSLSNKFKRKECLWLQWRKILDHECWKKYYVDFSSEINACDVLLILMSQALLMFIKSNSQPNSGSFHCIVCLSVCLVWYAQQSKWYAYWLICRMCIMRSTVISCLRRCSGQWEKTPFPPPCPVSPPTNPLLCTMTCILMISLKYLLSNTWKWSLVDELRPVACNFTVQLKLHIWREGVLYS